MNDTQTKHTPTPWKATMEDTDHHYVIESVNGEYCIAYTAGWYNDGPDESKNAQGDANAEFIVRACNSFEELLEAAQLLLAELNEHGDAERDYFHGPTLRAAIAKATGVQS